MSDEVIVGWKGPDSNSAVHQQLPLYLLEGLPPSPGIQDENLTTIERLAAAFQPTLLLRIPSAMSTEDDFLTTQVICFGKIRSFHWVQNPS
jgi:hypothetical protein